MPKQAKKMTVVVTGGAGFIGSHVVDRLVEKGYAVHVVDDLSTGDRKSVARGATLHVMDVRSPKLPALFTRLRPAVVAHLAAHIDLRRSVLEPLSDASINVMGGINVFSAAVAAGAGHVVFASTAAVYGGAGRVPTPEDDTTAPVSPYGAAKLACEHYLHVFHHLHGIHAASLRFANVYGPRQTPKGEAGAVAIFAERLRDGADVVINGDGEQTRDFVFVGDVADMVVHALERRLTGAYNVSTGKETTVNELYAELQRLSGSKKRASRGPSKPGDERRVSLNPAKANATGWRARTDLKKGLALTWEWAKKAGRIGKKK